MANKKTFAFSNANRVWTSRYSYTPTCYASIDDEFLSCPPTTKRDSLIYEHEKGVGYNSFYGTLYASYIAVSSNQDPSKEKIFKAVSLETNEGSWSAVLMTNDDAVNDVYFKIQQSFIPSFISKEGNKYAYVPPSIRNSTRNLGFYCVYGKADFASLTNVYSPTLSVTSAVYSGIISQMIANGFGGGETIQCFNNSFVFESQNSGQSNGNILFSIDTAPETIKTFYLVSTPLNETTEHSGSIQFSDFFNSISANVIPFEIVNDDVSINVKKVLEYIASQNNIEDISEIPQALIDYIAEVIATAVIQFKDYAEDSEEYVTIYSLTDPAIDGDSMRGKYMNILLTLDNPDKPFELYAINTEYAHSVLDSSLGQNS